eukprot:jgi/Astpho2/3264/Aster-x0153
MGNSKSFLHAEDSALQLPAGKLLVVALANIAGLQKVTQFALEHLWQPGDAIHEIYVEDSSAAGETAPSQHALSDQIEQAAKDLFRSRSSDKLQFEVELMVPPAPLDSTGDYDAGEEICDRAETLGVRAVVLLHHGKGMMQEMLFGSVTQYCSRNSKRPLLVYYQ